MAIKSVKLKESMSMSDLLALVEERWDEEKYGKASLMSRFDRAAFLFSFLSFMKEKILPDHTYVK